jgi:hypothetical protein
VSKRIFTAETLRKAKSKPEAAKVAERRRGSFVG